MTKGSTGGDAMLKGIRVLTAITVIPVLLLAASLALAGAEDRCSPKTSPTPYTGGIGPSRFNFEYFSDADAVDDQQTRWCYERKITNKHSQSQVWVHWKDAFGTIMNITIGPSSSHSVYHRNLGGAPITLSGTIDHGSWPEAKEGTLASKEWRSPEEEPKSARAFPPLVSGFDIVPLSIKESRAIPIKLEVSSEFDRDRRVLTYTLSNVSGPTPIGISGGRFPDQYPSIEWSATLLTEVQRFLKEKGIGGVDGKSSLSIPIQGVPDVTVKPGPVIIRLRGEVLFRGTEVLYVPKK